MVHEIFVMRTFTHGYLFAVGLSGKVLDEGIMRLEGVAQLSMRRWTLECNIRIW